jgi:rubrerythrin
MAGASAEWSARIAHAFSSHVREESTILESYEQLAAEASDDGVRMLLGLILADEHRHHELFERLAAAARNDQAGAIPLPPIASANATTALRAQAERFLEVERNDAQSLHRLRKDLKPAAGTTLWRLLVDLMELDTRKHIHILEYLRDRVS